MQYLVNYQCARCNLYTCVVCDDPDPRKIGAAVIQDHDRVSPNCPNCIITVLDAYELMTIADFADCDIDAFFAPCDCPACQAGIAVEIVTTDPPPPPEPGTSKLIHPNDYDKSITKPEIDKLVNRHPHYYPCPSNN